MQFFWVFILIAARFLGALLIFPLFNNSLLPRMLKTLLSAMFALIVFPRFINVTLPTNMVLLLILIVKEMAIGGCLGYLCGFPFWVIENVGNLIDMQRGEQFGAMVNQITKDPSSSISKLIFHGFMSYFAAVGGIAIFIKFVAVSFIAWPPAQFFFQATQYKAIISVFCDYFFWMVILALPVVFSMFVLEFVLGIFSSFVPQLNVTMLAMAIKSVVALFVLLLYVGDMYHFVIVKFFDGGLFEIFKN